MSGLSGKLHYYFTISRMDDLEAFRLAGVADVHITMRNAARLGIRPTELKDTFDQVMVGAGTHDDNAVGAYVNYLEEHCGAVDWAVAPLLGTGRATADAFRLLGAIRVGRVIIPFDPRFGRGTFHEFDRLSDPIYIDPKGWRTGRGETSVNTVAREYVAVCVRSRVHCGAEPDIKRVLALGRRVHSADGRPHALAKYAGDRSEFGVSIGHRTGIREGGSLEGLAETVEAIERFRRDCERRGVRIVRRKMIAGE